MVLESVWSFETSVTIGEIADMRTVFTVDYDMSFHVRFSLLWREYVNIEISEIFQFLKETFFD